VLGLQPLIQRIAAGHRTMFMVNLASPALYILQSRVMIRMDLGIFLQQHHQSIKPIYIMNFRERIHKKPLPQAISFLIQFCLLYIGRFRDCAGCRFSKAPASSGAWQMNSDWAKNLAERKKNELEAKRLQQEKDLNDRKLLD
jgi:hypothetical protein